MLTEGLWFQYICQSHEAAAIGSFFVSEFTYRFDVIGIFQVSDRAANFDKYNISVGFYGQFPQFQFDLACNMGNHLNVPAEIAAVTLLVQNQAEDLSARGKIVSA